MYLSKKKLVYRQYFKETGHCETIVRARSDSVLSLIHWKPGPLHNQAHSGPKWLNFSKFTSFFSKGWVLQSKFIKSLPGIHKYDLSISRILFLAGFWHLASPCGRSWDSACTALYFKSKSPLLSTVVPTLSIPKQVKFFVASVKKTKKTKRKMREIVHIQAGQCGNQIGAKVRKTFEI